MSNRNLAGETRIYVAFGRGDAHLCVYEGDVCVAVVTRCRLHLAQQQIWTFDKACML
jgi:hypothetical protein